MAARARARHARAELDGAIGDGPPADDPNFLPYLTGGRTPLTKGFACGGGLGRGRRAPGALRDRFGALDAAGLHETVADG